MTNCGIKKKIARDIEKIYCNNIKIARAKRQIHMYRKRIQFYLRVIELFQVRIDEGQDRIHEDREDIREDDNFGAPLDYDEAYHREDIFRTGNNIGYNRRQIRKYRQYIVELECAIHNKQKEIHCLEDENRCLERQINQLEDISSC